MKIINKSGITNYFLYFVIFLAAFLRLNDLSNIPPSGSLDEVSIGYNAYSILKTGSDEYGTKFPILLRAYDDFRPALYVYLVIPFIMMFDLTVLAVRLPSAILSIITVIATYFLIYEFVKGIKSELEAKIIGLIGAFLLAVSPWHVYISRLGHEANAGLSFTIFAILFFVKGMNNLNKAIYLFFSVIFFSLSLYTYQSEKIFVPLIVIVLIFVFRKKLALLKNKILYIFIGIILIIPLILSTLNPQALIRFRGTSAFSDSKYYRESAENVLKYRNEGNLVGELINNRRFIPLRIFMANYFSHFNPIFIFSNSGNESFKSPNLGLMYIWELPFLVFGIVYILFKIDKKIKIVIVSWVLVSFVAPSITTQAPHAMRAYNILPIPQTLVAIGLTMFLSKILDIKYKIANIQIKYLILSLCSLLFISNLFYFYRQYFYDFPKNQSSSFQYALSKTIPFVLEKEEKYKKVVFSNQNNLYQSYMFFLFYSKYDPFKYQKNGGTRSGGFAQAHFFEKYEFRSIDFQKERFNNEFIYIVNPSENILSKDGLKIKELNGKDSIIILL